MLNSIFDLTPAHLLKEIIIYDDCSEDDVIITDLVLKYGKITGWPMEKIISKRSDERQGLIRAKVNAARLGSADVLIFMDSHCEVTPKWIEPLLVPIQEDRTKVVVPIVDLINPVNFEYSKAMVARSVFDWQLRFKWKYFDWSYFDTPENNVKLFRSPIMPGGLLAIDRKFYTEMGEYDSGMEIWGAENIELSIRVSHFVTFFYCFFFPFAMTT
ncbi:hypothetical protein AB6A40_004855 [Gnathostoma spinigerum]|uniref:Glycosyltransferase 2-like domain-containing protein n=1 Tax=Gnathostoma spinigerum TaxID=75299 RepID=A0ABD6EL56_9BILA